MMKKISLIVLVVGALLGVSQEKTPEGRALVEAWFEATNALDGSEESVARLVALYRPDAQHIQGPTGDHQRGTVTFDGATSLETMARDLGERFESFAYRIESVTANEVSRTLFHRAEGPWGGESVAVQFWAVYSRRTDGVRFAQPGAAFFQIEEGKIRRLRLYLAEGERAEVEPIGR